MRRFFQAAQCAAIPALFACGGDTTGVLPEPPPLPALEPIEWDALGDARVAFTRHVLQSGAAGVYVLDGTTRTSVRFGQMFDPALSPDATQLAFLKHTSLQSGLDVHVRTVASGTERQLSALVGADRPPSWSRLGTHVLFAVAHPGSAQLPMGPALYRATPEGGPPELLWHSTNVNHSPFGRISEEPTGMIAFAPLGPTLLVLQPGATQATTIYTAPPASRVYSPQWSPNGSRIAFLEIDMTDLNRTATRVRTISRTGTDARTVVTLPASGAGEWATVQTQHSLCWLSADRLLFTHGQSSPSYPFSSIYAVSLAGDDLVRVTTASDVSDISVSCAPR